MFVPAKHGRRTLRTPLGRSRRKRRVPRAILPVRVSRVEWLESRCLLDAAPFAIGGDPRVDPADFRVTTFATGLNFPYGLQILSDGSLLVASSKPVTTSMFNSVGELIRFEDSDRDGVADGPGTVLFTGLPGVVTAVRAKGDLIFVTSAHSGNERISILRQGATPADNLTFVDSIDFLFPNGWGHRTYGLAVRDTPGPSDRIDLFFNVGAEGNNVSTTNTVSISGLLNASLHGESIYRMTLEDNGTSVTAINRTQIASGLRNATGLAFDPGTGDLYFSDNGIDTPGMQTEPLSADELNRIPVAQIGGDAEHFGFSAEYVEYRTGTQIGSGGVPPLVAFQPIPDPLTGAESEGSTEIAFAPAGFPLGLNDGIFIGFHGQGSLGGIANEENPLVYYDRGTGEYFHFISNEEAAIGHPNSLAAEGFSLFVADLSSTGALSGLGTGAIYQIEYVAPPVIDIDEPVLGEEGVPVTLVGSGSGAIDLYEWDLDNSGSYESQGLTAQFTALNEGTYTVGLRASGLGGSDTATVSIHIANGPPVAMIAGPESARANATLAFLLSAQDPSPLDQTEGFDFLIDWNDDGTFEQTIEGGSSVVANYTFVAAGSYAVRLQAIDHQGAVGALATHVVHVFSVDTVGLDLVWEGSDGDDWVEFVQLDAATVEVRTLLLGGKVVEFVEPLFVAGQIRAAGGPGNDRLDAGQVESISVDFAGGYGDDTLIGGDADDVLQGDFEEAAGDGAEGNDWIEGRGGNDSIFGDGVEGGADTILGGDGDDTLRGDGGDGTEGRADSLLGGAGNDHLRGHTGHDVLDGGPDDDLLIGGRDGMEGNDTLIAGSGNDILVGESGNDRLEATSGMNLLLGGAGSDTLVAGGGGDLLVADATLYDQTPAGLTALRDEWTSAKGYVARVENIRTGGGLTGGSTLEVGSTVVDDAAIDYLFGNDQFELNWYVYNFAFDQITGQQGSELADDTDGT